MADNALDSLLHTTCRGVGFDVMISQAHAQMLHIVFTQTKERFDKLKLHARKKDSSDWKFNENNKKFLNFYETV